jgi:hypothetical protein
MPLGKPQKRHLEKSIRNSLFQIPEVRRQAKVINIEELLQAPFLHLKFLYFDLL